MSTIGYGYGSEWHLLRYLGYHRSALQQAIGQVIPGLQGIDWLDHPFDPANPFLSREWKGLDFLPLDMKARKGWPQFWPQMGNVQNWDAVGKVVIRGEPTWLLVEAKAHVGEITSSCGARAEGGLGAITRALDETKQHMGIPPERDWLRGYYQMANRLAVLSYLNSCSVRARLLNIYFLGDRNPVGICPEQEKDWNSPLEQMYQHLGLHGQMPLMSLVHRLFLPVCPRGRVRQLHQQLEWSPRTPRRGRAGTGGK